ALIPGQERPGPAEIVDRREVLAELVECLGHPRKPTGAMVGLPPALWQPAGMRLVTFRDRANAVAVAELANGRLRTLAARSMIEWLSGSGREPTGVEHGVDEVSLLAPVPDPPSVRDFYAFERHVAAGWRRRGAEVPDYWYEAPAFYFSNPASIQGPAQPVARPPATSQLDCELEIAAIVD